MVIRVANAPCSWGVLEFDRESVAISYSQVLDEIVAAGYAGTELGDWGFLPTDPERLAEELRARRLELMAAFVPIAFANIAAHPAGEERALRVARLLRAAGGESAVVVLADDNGRVPIRTRHAGRIRAEHGLRSDQWTAFARGVERVARATHEETGLRAAFHPHCGGYVETMAEIEHLMVRTDPALVGLCLDTGHAVFGGSDPVAIVDQYASRLWHVHLKDCDPIVAEEARTSGLEYTAAVRRRLFCELGAGQVDVPSVIARLKQRGYQGWMVIEQDAFPGYGTPLESARRSREYLRGLGL